MPEIKLVIAQNDKVIKLITKEIHEHGFAKAVEEFQVVANAAMTKLIEDAGETGHCIMEEDSDGSENNDDDLYVTPKKKKI